MAETNASHLTSSTEPGVLVMTITEKRVEGEETAEALREEMLATVAAAGAREVVVDFRNAQYISSAAFRPLLSLRRQLQQAGGRVVLCGLSAAVGDVFHTTRMVSDRGEITPLFEMEPDLASAIARLKRPAGDK